MTTACKKQEGEDRDTLSLEIFLRKSSTSTCHRMLEFYFICLFDGLRFNGP